MEKLIRDMTDEEIELYCNHHDCHDCVFGVIDQYGYLVKCFKEILFEGQVEIPTENTSQKKSNML